MKNAPVISSYELALACVDFLWKQDAALRSLGLERLSIKAGQVTVAMTVLPAMVNGLGITHGGAIFAFADSAFSLACNTYNERTISAHCSISFLRPINLGDRLIATATEVVRFTIRYLRRERDLGERDCRGVPRAFAGHWWTTAALRSRLGYGIAQAAPIRSSSAREIRPSSGAGALRYLSTRTSFDP